MRGDKEMGAVVATQIVEEEGPSRDGDTNAGGEPGQGRFGAGQPGQGRFGAGEPGGDGDWGEHGEPVLEVCETQGSVHRAQRRGTV